MAALATSAVEADCPGPWLRTWVEFQVDARVNAAFRELAQGDYGVLVSAKQTSADVRDALARLEMEVGDVMKSHTKLRTVVQGLADELVDVREAGVGAAADLKDVQLLRQEVSRHEGNLTDLRQTLREVNSYQRRSANEVETLRAALGETQEEVGGLAVLAERLEQCLAQCHDQVAAAASEVAQGTLSPVAGQPQDMRLSMAAVDGLQQDLTRLAAVQAELDAQTRHCKAELESRTDKLQRQLDSHSSVTPESIRRHLQDVRTELQEAHDAGLARLQEKQASMEHSFHAWSKELEQRMHTDVVSQAGAVAQKHAQRCVEDMLVPVAAVDGLQQHLSRLTTMQAELESQTRHCKAELESRTDKLQRQLDGSVTPENVRRHVQDLRAELQEAHDAVLERLQEKQAELESQTRHCKAELESRTEKLQRQLDSSVPPENIQRNLKDLRAELQEAHETVLARLQEKQASLESGFQVWSKELEQRMHADVASQANSAAQKHSQRYIEEVTAAQKKTTAELRLELRSSLRSEAAAVAALDEQLWLTDQRLGQRIEELCASHAALREQLGHGAQQMAEVVEERPSRRQPTLATIPEVLEASIAQPVALPAEKDELADAEAPPPPQLPQPAAEPAILGRMVVTQSAINPGLPHEHSDRNRGSRVRFADAPDIKTLPHSESAEEENEVPAARPPEESGASTKFVVSQDLIAERRASRGAPPLSAGSDAHRSTLATHSEAKLGQSVDGPNEARGGTIGSLTLGSPADRAAAIAAARARLRVPNLRSRTSRESKDLSEQEESSTESSVQAATLGG